jgi:hypothetical protein
MALAGYVGLEAALAEMPVLQGFLLLLEGVSQLLTSCMACRGSGVRVSLAPFFNKVSPTLAFERSARAAFLVQNGLITFFVGQSVRQMAVSGRIAPKSWRTQASTGKSPFSGLYNINSKYQIRTTEAPPIAALSNQPSVRTGCFHNTETS